jgi:hypothetical protein
VKKLGRGPLEHSFRGEAEILVAVDATNCLDRVARNVAYLAPRAPSGEIKSVRWRHRVLERELLRHLMCASEAATALGPSPSRWLAPAGATT